MKGNEYTIGKLLSDGEVDIQTGPFGTQLKAKQYQEEGVPLINVRNIGYGKIRDDKLEYVDEETVERLNVHQLQKNDIVFGRKGAVDRHVLVGENQIGWMQGSDCIRLRVITERLSAKYLSYCFLSPTHQAWMLAQSGNKATMASLNHDIISRIVFNFQPRPIQDEIVKKISAYDLLIENNTRRIALLEQASRTLYEEWFVRLRFPGREHTKVVRGVPEGWHKSVIELAIDINPSTVLSDEDEHWWVEMSALSNDSMVINGAYKRVGRSGTKFQNGDTLFARITPCLENGKTGFVSFLNENEIANGSTEFIVLRSKTLTPEYVYCLARTYDFRELAIKSMVGSSGRQRVRVACFDDYFLLQPPQKLLRIFTEFVRPVFIQIELLNRMNKKLIQARDLLLPRLMSGEVAV